MFWLKWQNNLVCKFETGPKPGLQAVIMHDMSTELMIMLRRRHYKYILEHIHKSRILLEIPPSKALKFWSNNFLYLYIGVFARSCWRSGQSERSSALQDPMRAKKYSQWEVEWNPRHTDAVTFDWSNDKCSCHCSDEDSKQTQNIFLYLVWSKTRFYNSGACLSLVYDASSFGYVSVWVWFGLVLL